ncbi:MAG: DUF4434 domain-containing protein [Firmicutes bacterium]|nr:DUF4434 domain-containing protein [Bacillota bacterium]MDD4264085.1 DUF4434 domain-containing protein [Bacillota bacterium]
MKGLVLFLLTTIIFTGSVAAIEKPRPKITGAFWQLHAGFFGRGEAYFEEQVDLMYKAGIKTIVIQDTAGDNLATYARSNQAKIKIEGPFGPGTHTLLIKKLPVTVSEIVTDGFFAYEIISPEPSPFLGDYGYKLIDGDTSIYGSVGWIDDGISKEVKININLEDEVEYIEVYFMTTNADIERDDVVLDGKCGEIFLVNDDLTQILDAAKKRGMDVWLGTKFSDTWWGDLFEGQKEIQDNIRTVEDLERFYGHYENLTGYYIPHEFRPDWRPKQNTEFFKELVNSLKVYNRPLAIAPFFRIEMAVKDHQDFWETFLREVDIDVLMLQDGIGSDASRMEKILPHYKMVQEIAHQKGIPFWSDVEVFHVEVPDRPAVSADMSKVKKQLETQAPYVDRIVIFDWLHYMSPLTNEKAKMLYEDYLDYINE